VKYIFVDLVNHGKKESEKEDWIIGELISKLEEDVLPTKLDVLKYFFLKYTVLKMNLSQCYIENTERIMEIWETVRLNLIVNKYKMIKKLSRSWTNTSFERNRLDPGHRKAI
jgi:hypothetical protein